LPARTSCDAKKHSQYFSSHLVSLGSGSMFDFLDSEDLEMLRRAIDARCKDLNIRADTPEAEMIASQLIELFQSGVTDEEELNTRLITMELFHRGR